MSLGRYLTESRCRRAALLLKSGGVTVAEAADRSGFGSVYAFSRTFRKVMGVAPKSLLPPRADRGRENRAGSGMG